MLCNDCRLARVFSALMLCLLHGGSEGYSLFEEIQRLADKCLYKEFEKAQKRENNKH